MHVFLLDNKALNVMWLAISKPIYAEMVKTLNVMTSTLVILAMYFSKYRLILASATPKSS